MIATSEAPVSNLTAAQATELARLVELEARWENLRIYQPAAPGAVSTLKELHQKQKAYEAFFAKLAAYNKQFRPAHVPELLLNNPSRLGLWCRRMRDLQMRVQQDEQGSCPVQLLEKAYRWSDRLADRLKKERIVRPTLAANIQGAIRELDELAQWCEGLSRVALAG